MNLKQDVVNELHRTARKKFKRRKVAVRGLNDLWVADLVEMIPDANINKGFKYILVVINAFSKYVCCEPVKRKTAKDVADKAGTNILGGFYEYELQKVKHPDVFLMEKVIRRKGDKVYV